jgi:hypothetical protein
MTYAPPAQAFNRADNCRGVHVGHASLTEHVCLREALSPTEILVTRRFILLG